MNNKSKFTLIQKIYARAEIPTFLKLMKLDNRICELGVSKGTNLFTMIWHTKPKSVLAIDAWSEELYPHYDQAKHDKHYKHVMDKLLPKLTKASIDIEVIKGEHTKLVNNYPDESFDYIHIDADHSYEGVKRYIEQWWPKIKKGGILSGYDYNSRNKYLGVVQAVDEFREANNIKYFHTTNEFPTTWIILKDE